MKTFYCLRALIKCVIGLGLLLPAVALAKGNGVGLAMEGTITNFFASGQSYHFIFTGTFRISRWYGISNSTVVIDCRQGFPATVTQYRFFVATHPTANAAQVRNNTNALLHILKAADGSRRMIKFELVDSKMSFGNGGSITNLESEVVRATDWDFESNLSDAR